MEEPLSSVKIHSRKRKKASPSSSTFNPLIGILTRSKSRIFYHQNRSGIFRPDPVRQEPIAFRPEVESSEAFPEVSCANASRISSIKDLRMRRVFTPDVSSVPEEEMEENEEGKKVLNGSDAAPDSSWVLDSGLGDAKVDELEKSGRVLLEALNERDNWENGLNLKDHAGNDSISETKTALSSCAQRKVFKAPSSFSYRRLLPYLRDVLNDDSGVSRIETADAGIPRKLQKLDDVNSDVPSIVEDSYAANAEPVTPHLDDANPSDNGEVKKLHNKEPFSRQNLDSAENELYQTGEIMRPLEVEQQCNENSETRGDALNEEECCQMTPPDPNIIVNTQIFHGADYVVAKQKDAEKQVSKVLSIGCEKSSNGVLRHSPDGKRDTNSIGRLVPNPCSRSRLFKNPRSLSYRRLLPFLMDISKNSNCMRLVDLKEELRPVSSAFAEQNQSNKIRSENSYDGKHTKNRMQSLLSSTAPMPPSDDSSPDSSNSLSSSMPNLSSNDYSSNFNPSSVTSETPLYSCGLNDLQIEGMPQPGSTPRKLEPGFDRKENSSALPPYSTHMQSISEEPDAVGKQMMQLNVGLELQNNSEESIYKVNLDQSSFRYEESDGSVAPIHGPLKGILKRNRLGCRGLCNCLNCSSFRLHADRAFEFSRNQMQDAEEVASDLMKELANLRLLLEKAFTNDNGLAASELNPVQVKGACNEALETENLAKERLSQLNYDLNVHCRIPALLQPKVTFANYIRERAIPLSNPSTNTEKKG